MSVNITIELHSRNSLLFSVTAVTLVPWFAFIWTVSSECFNPICMKVGKLVSQIILLDYLVGNYTVIVYYRIIVLYCAIVIIPFWISGTDLAAHPHDPEEIQIGRISPNIRQQKSLTVTDEQIKDTIGSDHENNKGLFRVLSMEGHR